MSRWLFDDMAQEVEAAPDAPRGATSLPEPAEAPALLTEQAVLARALTLEPTAIAYSEPASPTNLRVRSRILLEKRRERETKLLDLAHQFAKLNAYLEVAPKVTAALDQLNESLFRKLLNTVEEKLTIALREILDQPVALKATSRPLNGVPVVEFHIERDGEEEDVLRGQGGSVANILSVGLRMFALATLDPAEHRRFLVLDEQDCWLRPELVPKLVKIVRDAGAALGFQVLMISHHDLDDFRLLADKIYRFTPHAGTVRVEEVDAKPVERDAEK